MNHHVVHVVANGKISFIFGWMIFYCIYIPHPLYTFIYQWTLAMLTIVNNAEVNLGINISVWISVFIFFRELPQNGMLDFMIVLFLIIWGTSTIVFSSDCISLYYHKQVWGFSFIHILTNTYYCLLSFW